ncbi:hypothetical protein [Streptomyces sp. NPDC058683]|uniref:hypothetical protein n=1 Tax=Streptomyces sp. NPDC058683 TaxID=3346597 RepID=UPI003661EC96
MKLQGTVRKVIACAADAAAATGTRVVLAAYWGTSYVLSGRQNSTLRKPDTPDRKIDAADSATAPGNGWDFPAVLRKFPKDENV